MTVTDGSTSPSYNTTFLTLAFTVADGELTGTGRSAAFDVRVVIEMRGVVLGEGVLCEMCICLAGGGVGGVGGE